MNLEARDQSEQAAVREYMETLAVHTRIAAELTQGDGFLAAIAAEKRQRDPDGVPQVSEELLTAPKTIFETVLMAPQKGKELSPRWQLVQQLETATKNLVAERESEIIDAAVSLGMRREGDTEAYTAINSENAVFVIEGGANKTSIVRRGVMEAALKGLYGNDLHDKIVFQLGGTRIISPQRADGSNNPEHNVIRGLAADFLPAGSFTEADANLATALADGYEISYIRDRNTVNENLPVFLRGMDTLDPAIGRIITLKYPDGSRPWLVQVRPTGPRIEGGFDALAAIIDLQDRQLVVASNGQYRSKNALLAYDWAADSELSMKVPVVLGDEPGDITRFHDETIQTPARPAGAYVNEIALYGAQAAASYMKHNPGRWDYPGSVTIGQDGEEKVVEPDGTTWVTSSGGMLYSSPTDPGTIS